MSESEVITFAATAIVGPMVTAVLKTNLGSRLAGLGVPVNALACLLCGLLVWGMEGAQEGALLPLLGLSLKAAVAGSALVAVAEHPRKRRATE